MKPTALTERISLLVVSGSIWNDAPKMVKAQYAKTTIELIYVFTSRTGHEKPCLNPAGPPAKTKYGK